MLGLGEREGHSCYRSWLLDLVERFSASRGRMILPGITDGFHWVPASSLLLKASECDERSS